LLYLACDWGHLARLAFENDDFVKDLFKVRVNSVFLAELSLNYISGLFESAGIKNSYHNQKHACLVWQHTR
jgi:hypothetical protein